MEALCDIEKLKLQETDSCIQTVNQSINQTIIYLLIMSSLDLKNYLNTE